MGGGTASLCGFVVNHYASITNYMAYFGSVREKYLDFMKTGDFIISWR